MASMLRRSERERDRLGGARGAVGSGCIVLVGAAAAGAAAGAAVAGGAAAPAGAADCAERCCRLRCLCRLRWRVPPDPCDSARSASRATRWMAATLAASDDRCADAAACRMAPDMLPLGFARCCPCCPCCCAAAAAERCCCCCSRGGGGGGGGGGGKAAVRALRACTLLPARVPRFVLAVCTATLTDGCAWGCCSEVCEAVDTVLG